MAKLLHAAIAEAGWRDAPARDPADAEAYLALLGRLYSVGRHDLPLGRLLEGHVDAAQIVGRYGTPAQRAGVDGATMGVWGAALPGEPLVLANGRLNGGKSYASGSGVLSHALVGTDTPDGLQLILLDLARTAPAIDREWWRVTGMQRSETHRVRWADAMIEPGDLIGAPGNYAREPWFSGGALRFVAVHAGGIAAVFDRAGAHLIETGRADDPFQTARLAELFELTDGAAGVVRRTARCWFMEDDAARLPRVAAARLAVAAAGARAIAVAQEAVGLPGMFQAHPLATAMTDLAVYLRQPAPDAQRLRVGRAAAAGALTPGL